MSFLVVINAEEGIIEQDKKIAGYAHEAGRAIVIVVNKWDAVEKDEKTMKEFEQKIRDHFLFLRLCTNRFPFGENEKTDSYVNATD